MKNHAKVSKTEAYTDPQGEHIVCRGKLVLIKSKYVPDGNVYVNSIGYKSIIISETEPIKATFEKPLWVYDCRKDMDGFIHQITCSIEKHLGVYKIIALP